MAATVSPLKSAVPTVPNPSLQPTCYGWLRQPAQAAELKRWADQGVRLVDFQPHQVSLDFGFAHFGKMAKIVKMDERLGLVDIGLFRP